MGLCESVALGGYVAAEASSATYARLYRPDATKRPIIYFTGGPGDARDYLTATSSGSQIGPSLAESVPVISAAFGGGNQWGNDTSQTRIGQLWTYVKSQLGTKTDKFVGIGVSKGMTALLNYTRANPGNVAALLGIVPAVNVSDIHDNNRGGNQASIDTAYGAAWAANAATHDPALNTTTHASQAIPMKLIYGDSDTVVIPSTVTAFASAVGATAVSKGATDHLTTAPAIDSYVDVWKFIAPYV
jgi:hypothetical protein